MDDVLSGRRVAGRKEQQAVQRHRNDLKKAKKKGLYFDEAVASRSCDFFGLLKLTDGEWAGQPFVLKPFQRFIVWCLTGWRRASDGMRRFRRAWLSMARGNGKTPFLAALAILFFAFDSPVEPHAECYAAATTVQQCQRYFFGDLKKFIAANEGLQRLIEVHPNVLEVPRTGAKFEILSGDGGVADGARIHFVAVDEVHEYVGLRYEKLWDKIVTALGKRRQPMFVAITTAGDENSDLWEEQSDFASKVVDQTNQIEADDLFVFICEIDDGDDPFDEACWPKANPMLEHGVVKIDHLRSLRNEAKWNPTARNKLLRYHCNKLTTRATKLVPRELWAMGNKALPNLAGQQCRGGFDWGWKDDLAALALVFPLDTVNVAGETRRRYAALVEAWIPEGSHRDLTSEPWASWIKDGLLRVTAGDTTDTAAIYARLGELVELYGIASIAMDPNNCREFGSRAYGEFGIEAFWFGQTHSKYNEPTRELLTALRERRFLHGGNPLLAWAADNVVGSTDSREYVKPEKKRSKDKIDPFCAVVMALSENLFAETEGPSIYEQPGNLVL